MNDYLIFEENVNPKHLEYLQRLCPDEVKDLCLDNAERKGKTPMDEDGNEYNINAVINGIMRMEPKQTMRYGFSKKSDCGRRYANNRLSARNKKAGIGFPVQKLPENLRAFLCFRHYHDYDIVNCHFALLLQLAEEHSLPRIYLQRYVEHRADVLEETEKTKLDMLTVLNMDHPKLSHPTLKALRGDIESIRDTLLDHYNPPNPSGNVKNPLSARLNYLLTKRENELLERAVKHLKLKEVVLMYDGFMCREVVDVEELHRLTGVAWAEKPLDDSIVMDDEVWERELFDYATVKAEFEKTHFMTTKPLAFYIEEEGELTEYNWADFKLVTSNIQYEDKGKEKELSSRWLKDKTRRQYRETIFYPDPDWDADASANYNLFQPFAFERTELVVDEQVTPAQQVTLDLTLAQQVTTIKELGLETFSTHIDLLTDNYYPSAQGKIKREYFLNFLAHLVQKPYENPRVAIAFRGAQGCGKDTIIYILGKGLGERYVKGDIDDMNQVFGNFNEITSQKLVLGFNEVRGQDGKDYANRLKNLVTQHEKQINPKYGKMKNEEVFTRIFAFSQDTAPLDVEEGYRRIFVCSTSASMKGDTDFWTAYYSLLNDPAYIRRIFHFLKHRDISKWSSEGDLPMTETKRTLIMSRMKTAKHFLEEFNWEFHAAHTKKVTRRTIGGEVYHSIKKADLHDEWDMWDDDHKPKIKRGDLMKEWMVGLEGIMLANRWGKYDFYNVHLEKMRKKLKEVITVRPDEMDEPSEDVISNDDTLSDSDSE